MTTISVCIVDDNKELRDALVDIISMSDGFKCIDTAGNIKDTINRLPLLKPDLVLIDINFGGPQGGIDVIQLLKPKIPDTNFLVSTVYEEHEKIFDALKAGSTGYILKKTDPLKILEVIQGFYEGEAFMSTQIAQKVKTVFLQKINQDNNENKEQIMLTTKEKEILEFLSKGFNYNEIANQIFLSPEAVRKNIFNIYEKLHTLNRITAVKKISGE